MFPIEILLGKQTQTLCVSSLKTYETHNKYKLHAATLSFYIRYKQKKIDGGIHFQFCKRKHGISVCEIY